jgi:hypothetical protein
MSHLIEIAAMLWPPLRVIGLFALFVMIVGRLGRQVVAIGFLDVLCDDS